MSTIIGRLPKQRRTGLFSATQTVEVEELARAGLRNPVRVTVRDAKGAADGSKASAAGDAANGLTPRQLRLQYTIMEQHRKARKPAPCPRHAMRFPGFDGEAAFPESPRAFAGLPVLLLA